MKFDMPELAIYSDMYLYHSTLDLESGQELPISKDDQIFSWLSMATYYADQADTKQVPYFLNIKDLSLAVANTDVTKEGKPLGGEYDFIAFSVVSISAKDYGREGFQYLINILENHNVSYAVFAKSSLFAKDNLFYAKTSEVELINPRLEHMLDINNYESLLLKQA